MTENTVNTDQPRVAFDPSKEPPVFRFRSLNGSIYSSNPDAFTPRVTTTRVRKILNALYRELLKYDPVTAEEICKYYNA